MKKTTVYLIRHGESMGNLEHRFLGQADEPLSPLGHEQAERTSEYLVTIPVDVIYSSDLIRARQTAEHTAKKLGLPVHTSSALREIYAGQWEGKHTSVLLEQFKDSYETWRYNIGAVQCPDGESVRQVQERFVPEVERILRENEGKTIFIFCHATPIRLLRAAWEGVPLEEVRYLPRVSNSSVTKGEYADGAFRILQYSYDDFLGDLKIAPPTFGLKEKA